jgi:hypothetical protein
MHDMATAANRDAKNAAAESVGYVMRLPDGRRVYLELPEAYVSRDRGGQLLLRPPAVRMLDEVRALAMQRVDRPTPAYLVTLREALGMTQEQFGEIQEKLGEMQGRLGDIQGEIGSKQGEFGERMGELGEKMGVLGEQMGRLGEQQGKIAEQADEKVKSIIDQSLKNGKARPIQ